MRRDDVRIESREGVENLYQMSEEVSQPLEKQPLMSKHNDDGKAYGAAGAEEQQPGEGSPGNEGSEEQEKSQWWRLLLIVGVACLQMASTMWLITVGRGERGRGRTTSDTIFFC